MYPEPQYRICRHGQEWLIGWDDGEPQWARGWERARLFSLHGADLELRVLAATGKTCCVLEPVWDRG